MFPQLQKFLPAKHHQTFGQAGAAGASGASDASAPAGPTGWSETSTDKGYVAWTVSDDGRYRLIVGCHAQPADSPVLQVRALDGSNAPNVPFTLDYQFGSLPLRALTAQSGIVGAVAQFSDVSVKNPAGTLLTHFTLDGVESGKVARGLQNMCAEGA
jgi:hypothetical protein